MNELKIYVKVPKRIEEEIMNDEWTVGEILKKQSASIANSLDLKEKETKVEVKIEEVSFDGEVNKGLDPVIVIEGLKTAAEFMVAGTTFIVSLKALIDSLSPFFQKTKAKTIEEKKQIIEIARVEKNENNEATYEVLELPDDENDTLELDGNFMVRIKELERREG